MHPFHKALHKKKMEGLMISIHPVGHDDAKEEMKQAASRGDAAPEVLDKHEDESLEADPQIIPDESEHLSEDVQEPPHKKHKKPSSLREKAEAVMKKKGY